MIDSGGSSPVGGPGPWRSPLLLGAVTAVLLAGAFAVLEVTPGLGNRLMDASSTDWPTLRRDPVLPWITSAVWVSEGTEAVVFWIVVLPTALVLLAHRVGTARALLIAAAAHLLGTLGSEGLLGLRYLTGGVSHRALYLLDVGPSYLAVGTVAGLVVVERGPRRLVALGGLVALLGLPQIGLLDGLGSLQVSPVGHVLATVFAAVTALLLGRPTAARLRRGSRVSARAAPPAAGRSGRSR